ncbi:hypothetical protein [Streptomyces parvus]|uniref:Uncharacterized protein n=1 Tax=Streptomyces parvus TaxID=66428 RepID=A0A7K3S136_9ACTN|nr:hypothetical protein [Streptomyces parvus]NEC21201.1 hypothetical protein [Streptomyces parvus]NEE29925.1 hypothetical protein [Streptomyces sp. SID7982]
MKEYTEHQVTDAAYAAKNLILGEIECGQVWEDLLSLMVNATVTVLASGLSAGLEEIVRKNYGQELEEFKSDRGF